MMIIWITKEQLQLFASTNCVENDCGWTDTKPILNKLKLHIFYNL